METSPALEPPPLEANPREEKRSLLTSFALNVSERFVQWARKVRLTRHLAFILTIAFIISGSATYYAITHGSEAFGPDPATVTLLLTDLVLLLALSIILIKRFVYLWLSRKSNSAGSRLQSRIIIMFTIVTVIPTVIVAIFAALFLNFGVQSWFDQRVSTALEESVAVAEAYLSEHQKVIQIDIQTMARDISNSSALLTYNPSLFNKIITGLAGYGALSQVVVFQTDKILAKSHPDITLANVPKELTDRADKGEIVIQTDANNSYRVHALIKLKNFKEPTYLLVGRAVNEKVINHMKSTQGAVQEYQEIQADISRLQQRFLYVFIAVASLLLLSAIWLGTVFAVDLARPVSRLVAATRNVREGDLSVRVDEEGPHNDEMVTLSRAFNRMTEQIDQQHNALTEAYHQIDARRVLTETVLSGVSAGVIALNNEQQITMFNRSAVNFLALDPDTLDHANFGKTVPEMQSLMEKAMKNPEKPVSGEVVLMRNEHKHILLVRIAAEKLLDTIEGYVITFDDITELLTIQRRAAWSDVARRIAHEIKNPLTPIHLAVDRIKRKYGEQISEDKDTFQKYTDTIIHHVTQMGKMVDEFANFARMPLPVFAKEDIGKLVTNAIFSEKDSHSNITFSHELTDTPVKINCDAGQISQALLNILKNAAESVTEQHPESGGKIHLRVSHDANSLTIRIRDNGTGFPQELLDRLTEPYITTRSRGSGLGLSIVTRIIDDHNGKLTLSNWDEGAQVDIRLPSGNSM